MTAAAQPPSIRDLAAAQIRWTSTWHTSVPAHSPLTSPDLPSLVEREHHANFALWHQEDKARDPSATDADVAAVKRSIDALNQQRNDLVEGIDLWLLEHVVPSSMIPSPVLHSETPGMMLDRLSILALKIFHTAEEAARADATEAHRARNTDRLAILQEQRVDLVAALEALLQAVTRGERSFKLYRQLKMYNDPELNPSVYGRRRG